MSEIWQQQRMVEMRMRDIEREIDQARLVREAGLASGPNWIARIAAALRRRAAAQAPLQEKRSGTSRAYRMLSKKTAEE